MVPFLYLFYTQPELAGVGPGPELATLAAHATSLAVIVPTSLLGTWRFHRQRAIVWRAAVPIGVAAAAAAVLGSRLAPLADPRLLRLGFGVLLLFSALRLLRARGVPAVEDGLPARPLRLSLPVTLGVVRVPLRRVAATSMAIIALTSLAGAAAYMFAAPPAVLRPGWSAGYVDLPVALLMSAGALLSVALGAALNRRLDARALAVVFALLFAVVGVRLVAGNLGGS